MFPFNFFAIKKRKNLILKNILPNFNKICRKSFCRNTCLLSRTFAKCLSFLLAVVYFWNYEKATFLSSFLAVCWQSQVMVLVPFFLSGTNSRENQFSGLFLFFLRGGLCCLSVYIIWHRSSFTCRRDFYRVEVIWVLSSGECREERSRISFSQLWYIFCDFSWHTLREK